MNPDNQSRSEWIEQYLRRELEGDELDQFNERLRTDADFGREVAAQRAIFVHIRRVGRAALRRKLVAVRSQLDLPWPGENFQPDTRALPQETTFPPVREQSGVRRYYAVAAAIALLLLSSGRGYWYRRTPAAPTTQRGAAQRSAAKDASTSAPQATTIRLERTGGSRNFGFGGADSQDTTLAVLLYPVALTKAYQFDDTLRLYGNFNAAWLFLQYDSNTKRYTLREDSLSYPLQRYRPRQALTPVSNDQ